MEDGRTRSWNGGHTMVMDAAVGAQRQDGQTCWRSSPVVIGHISHKTVSNGLFWKNLSRDMIYPRTVVPCRIELQISSTVVRLSSAFTVLW